MSVLGGKGNNKNHRRIVKVRARLHYYSWEVAELLGVTNRTVQRWCRQDTGKSLIRLTLKELHLFLNKHIQ